jgi:tRNA (uracil-5-)-methyltransferase
MDYETQLAYKTKEIKEMFGLESIDVIPSLCEHFRNRAEFRIYHDYDNDTISYAMHGLEQKRLVPITACSIVAKPIATIMQPLLQEIAPNEILRKRLFAVEFLSSSTNELLVTLIYHKKIDEVWQKEAQKAAEKLGIDLIGRSRGVKIVVTKEYIDERLQIEGKPYYFRLYDTGFTQPNSGVNQAMIAWVKQGLNSGIDLLELYCGHGNFTIPLAEKFNRVLATEISKRSILTARENCEKNGVKNIDFVRLSAEELTEALQKRRQFKRLEGIDLDAYNFSHLFVDPPRAGLDEKSRDFARGFENLIYISCNPKTLKRDLELLERDFTIERFAVFDQFAYTKHMECGLFLKRR